MKRLFFILVCVTAVLGMAPRYARADVSEAGNFQPAVCIIKENGGGSLAATRDVLVRHGVRALHIFPPKAIFGRFPCGFDEGELSSLHVDMVRSPEDILMKGVDPVVAQAVRALFRDGEASSKFEVPSTLPMNDLLLQVPADVRASRGLHGSPIGAPAELFARGIFQNTEFMIGTVLVNVVFPESAGGSEDWTDEELADATSCIVLGLSQYQRCAPLTDPLRLDFVYNYFTRVPVSIEPIEGDRSTDPIWMGEVLQYLGYPNDMWETHTLNNDTRIQFGTDWVFTAFVVDASFNGCWKGPAAGYYAYGYLGGPLMVIPYPTCGWSSPEGFTHIFIHEVGHLFWALDEYVTARFACTDSSGYLRVPDRNTYYEPCESPLQACIMNNAPLALPMPICTYTLGQIGLADADGDMSPDIYGVPPEWRSVDIQRATGDTIYDDLFEVKATVVNDAVPNANPYQNPTERIDYAPWLIGGTYRIGTGPEHETLPVDSMWDESREDLDFLVSGFSAQDNDLYLKVRNCAGLETEIHRHVYYVATMLQDFSARPREASIEVSWRLSETPEHAAFMILRAEGPNGEYVELLNARTRRNGSSFSFEDEQCEPGTEYRYRVQIAEGRGRRTLFETDGVMLPALALRLDQNHPNPFNPSTEMRFFLPEACRIALDVYDIKGHLISRLAGGYRDKGTYGAAWDGRDTNGRRVSSGIYFYRLKAGKEKTSRKMVLLQ